MFLEAEILFMPEVGHSWQKKEEDEFPSGMNSLNQPKVISCLEGSLTSFQA